MKNLLYLIGFVLFVSCSSSMENVFYQVTLETGNLKPSDILLKPLYQKKENQCGALFLDKNDLTVINNFDTSQVFINVKYKYEKNASGLYDTYTFEDVFLKKKEAYTVLSSLRDEAPVLEIKAGKVKVLDKSVEVIEKQDGSTLYLRKDTDANGKEFTEMYTIKKIILNQVIYDKYSFPCE
jgi:hypothetical protein